MNYQKAIQQQLPIENGAGDCAVKALSIVCDVPYAVAHKTLASVGRINRKGTHPEMTRLAIEKLGFSYERVHTIAKTVGQLEKLRIFSSGYYSIRVRGHRLAMKDGIVEDWSRGGRRRICEVYKVKPAVSRKERKQRIKQIMEA